MTFDPNFIDQDDIKSFYIHKKDLGKYNLHKLKLIAKNRPDLFKGYSKNKTKPELVSFMKRRVKTTKFIYKKPKTITVQLKPNMVKAIKNIGKSKAEYSIGIDFERYGKVSERIFAMRAGKWETVKIENFEMFGHTHPYDLRPMPSASDLMNLEPFVPEFIVAGKSGEMIILNVENIKRFGFWRNKNQHKGINDFVFELDELRIDTKGIRNPKGLIKPRYKKYILTDNIGRDVFYRETGVRVYPYRRGMRIEIKDRLQIKKKVPNIPKEDLQYYHGQS